MRIIQRKRAPIFRLVVVLAIMAVGGGCVSSDDAADNTREPGGIAASVAELAEGDRVDIEDFIGTSLPASAVNIQYQWEFGVDSALMLRMDLPAEDAEGFLESLDLAESLTEGRDRVRSSSPDWFRTDELTSFAGAATESPKMPIQLTVDTSDAMMSTVYLLAFTV